MMLMTTTILFSVKSYGEFEFWFAGIKVAAILVFIGLATLFVFGLWPNKSMDFSNLWSHGGFMPMGFGVITVGIVTVIFSMVGPEIATIAAAESSDPERAVKGGQLGDRANRAVLCRLDIPARHGAAMGRQESCRVAVRLRIREDGHPVRRSRDERGGLDRGAELSQFGYVHSIADAVRARRAA